MSGAETSNSVPQLNIEYLFTLIYKLLTGGANSDRFVDFLRTTWDVVNFLSIFIAPLLLFGIVYAAIRLGQVKKASREQFETSVRRVAGETRGNERWQRITEHVSSENPAEWRHAIIEADSFLDELLKQQGYTGDTLGERLKSISRDGLRSLDAAWEAHKIRNEIAHAGSDFILTQRTARRAVDNYRSVFEELGAFDV